MSEIEMPIKGLPPELSELEAGDEVHLEVLEKSPNSIRFSVSPCSGIEDDMEYGGKEDDSGGEEPEGEPSPEEAAKEYGHGGKGPMHGKGVGLVIVLGGKK